MSFAYVNKDILSQVHCYHGDSRRFWGHVGPIFKLLEGQLDRCSICGYTQRTQTHTCLPHTCLHRTITVDVNAYANTKDFTVASKIQQSTIDKGTTSKQRLLAGKIPQHTKAYKHPTTLIFSHQHVHMDRLRGTPGIRPIAISNLSSFRLVHIMNMHSLPHHKEKHIRGRNALHSSLTHRSRRHEKGRTEIKCPQDISRACTGTLNTFNVTNIHLHTQTLTYSAWLSG